MDNLIAHPRACAPSRTRGDAAAIPLPARTRVCKTYVTSLIGAILRHLPLQRIASGCRGMYDEIQQEKTRKALVEFLRIYYIPSACNYLDSFKYCEIMEEPLFHFHFTIVIVKLQLNSNPTPSPLQVNSTHLELSWR